MKVKVKKGQEFYAIVRKGPRSLTLDGEEGSGRKIGPFIASRDSTSLSVETDYREFNQHDFKIELA